VLTVLNVEASESSAALDQREPLDTTLGQYHVTTAPQSQRSWVS